MDPPTPQLHQLESIQQSTKMILRLIPQSQSSTNTQHSESNSKKSFIRQFQNNSDDNMMQDGEREWNLKTDQTSR